MLLELLESLCVKLSIGRGKFIYIYKKGTLSNVYD